MSVNLKLVVLFSASWCFFVHVKSYRKKSKFKTGLITLYILLLTVEMAFCQIVKFNVLFLCLVLFSLVLQS